MARTPMKHGEAVNVSQRQGRESIWHVPRNTGAPTAIGTNIPESEFEVLGGKHTYESLTEAIAGVALNGRISMAWALALIASLGVLGVMFGSVVWIILNGVGVWGINIPVGWGWDIVNFVWWIGIGHAGTLISAVFLLVHQGWRTSINRFAEAMTLFAVMCAGLYPLMHVGRHQFAYWMLPLPNSMGLWPQFKSPLLWDVFAVSTYFTVSLCFWYVGLVPDLAVMRDRATSRIAKVIYGSLSLGWRNSGRHWHRYNAIYLLLAAFSTPLVLSVHSVVSFDFAFSNVPGWHTTIFPPYFVAGAVYAGFAMVLILAIPLRRWCHLEDFITMRHLENSAKVMLATSWIVFYGYIMEVFFGWYSQSKYEGMMLYSRFIGPHAYYYWALIFCNGVAPQILWWRSMRTSLPCLYIVSIIVSIGMWLERFVIIPMSLERDFLPSSWGLYRPTWVDCSLFFGTFGLFFTMFLLFCRFLPTIAIAEMRELLHHKLMHGHHHDDEHGDSHGHDAVPAIGEASH